MLKSALNVEDRRILLLRGRISATQPPAVAALAVVADIIAHPAVTARELRLGIKE